ncbi:uncharacterized protein LTR77_006375 [Saxophila tyrrhenica]|uniref:peptidylprolyl isomerase n=1 Tax=Saxophila tyrrhenica TaxID=1690608 RepID=A0AAV9P7Q1_9PEZI|nr:hypothetical protein LTR77_006375 [Saxophila tyrrhenica]
MRSLSNLPASLLALLSTIYLPPTLASPSDLKIEATTLTTCSRPSRNGDKLSIHYKGTLQSTGVEFDESYRRGAPFSFTLGAGQVISGWDEGLLDMCPGEARNLTIPPEMAYGDRGAPPAIPGGATLVFETKLVEIIGVEQESVTQAAETKTEGAISIETSPPVPPPGWSGKGEKEETEKDKTPTLEGTPLTSVPASPLVKEGECHLLGPFALIVQAALGGLALLGLVYKRWREVNKRPWKIWFFDVSKQVVGSMLLHVLNILMSMTGSGELIDNAKHAASKSSDSSTASDNTNQGGRATPNPCSFYILNLGIDTTVGIPVLYLFLKVLHVAFRYTPLARPPQSIKSGHYNEPGESPRTTWWLKQSLIYFIGLVGMKAFVFLLFRILPWLPWVGDWALRWTEGNEALQLAFAMFIFPLAMNAVQYWIIDSFIMDRSRVKNDGQGYQPIQSGDDEEGGGGVDSEDTVTEESVQGKGSGEDVRPPPLEEVNPTPIPDYESEDDHKGSGSRRQSRS